jgi:hypothetical protein
VLLLHSRSDKGVSGTISNSYDADSSPFQKILTHSLNLQNLNLPKKLVLPKVELLRNAVLKEHL